MGRDKGGVGLKRGAWAWARAWQYGRGLRRA